MTSGEFKRNNQTSQLLRFKQRKETATLSNFIPKAVNYPKRTKWCPLIPSIWWRFLPTSAFAGPHCHTKLTQRSTNRELCKIRCVTCEHMGLTCAFSGFAQSSGPVFRGKAWISTTITVIFQGNQPAIPLLRTDAGGSLRGHSSCGALAPSKGGHFLHSFCYKNAGVGRRDMELKRTALKHMSAWDSSKPPYQFCFP